MENGKYIGGLSPSIKGIVTEPELAIRFMTMLYRHQPDVDFVVQKLLFASLLQFYGDFVDLIMEEPHKKFENPRNHAVIDKIEQTKLDCGVTNTLFLKWQSEVKADFVRKNCMALPISDLDEDALVDGRSVIAYIKKVDKNSRASYVLNNDLHTKATSQDKTILELTKTLGSVVSELQDMRGQMNLLLQLKGVDWDEHKRTHAEMQETDTGSEWNQSEHETHLETSSPQCVPWERLVEDLSKCDLKGFLYMWYDRQADISYDLTANKTDKNVRNKKFRLNKIKGHLFKFKPPSLPPISDRPTEPDEISSWQRNLNEHSTQCYQNAVEQFETKSLPPISSHSMFMKHCAKDFKNFILE